jgi:hypothetical protein
MVSFAVHLRLCGSHNSWFGQQVCRRTKNSVATISVATLKEGTFAENDSAMTSNQRGGTVAAGAPGGCSYCGCAGGGVY